ncbi:hypothetical protein ACQ4PT_031296 [Festuca glaucescens]
MAARLLLFLALVCLQAPPWASAQQPEQEATVIVKGSAKIAETDQSYVCATMDWWPPEKCNYNQCPWGQSSILNLDLDHPFLAQAIQASRRLDQILWSDGIFMTKHPSRKPAEPSPGAQNDEKTNYLTEEQQLEAAHRTAFVRELIIGSYMHLCTCVFGAYRLSIYPSFAIMISIAWVFGNPKLSQRSIKLCHFLLFSTPFQTAVFLSLWVLLEVSSEQDQQLPLLAQVKLPAC